MAKPPEGFAHFPKFKAEVADAVARYEAAWQAWHAAFDRGFDLIARGQMSTLDDAHPAALDYRATDAGVWAASDAREAIIARGAVMAIKRGDVLYVRTSLGRDDERERKVRDGSATDDPGAARDLPVDSRIRRFDLGVDSTELIDLDEA